MTAYKPTRPVPRGCALGFFAGRYKAEPEDFVVEEVAAYEPCGEGEHLYLWTQKRGMSTLDLVDDVARMLDLDPRGIGLAGLKDAQSVSRQWLSVQGAHEDQVRDLAGNGWRVLRHSRHGNKLKMGHLSGNRFLVTLRGTVAGDLEKAQANLAELTLRGVPNYFGEQRFGKRGANLDKGLSILRGKAKKAAYTMPRRLFGLMISAVQSEVFNRVIIERLATLDTLLPGDLAFLHRNGACFPVVNAAAEQARATSFEVSPSGPMPGAKMMQPQGEPLAIEQRVQAAMELPMEQFAKLPFGLASGERRPLRVPITEAMARQNERGLELQFALPRGSFATSVLRELLEDTIWFQERS
ncbi:MAG: tRNA pseudouridine(13) synthase TruD [Planctomycetota bacterium]|nr:tRNA pseudouridine(13) synthase TruD [Planctomycetota bacterium]